MRMAKNADGCLARETNVLIFLMHFTLGFTIYPLDTTHQFNMN